MKFIVWFLSLVLGLLVQQTYAAAQAQTQTTVDSELKGLTDKIQSGAKLNRGERKKVATLEKQKYIQLRQQGVDEVSNTKDAIAMREYRLRQKKRKGLIRKRETTLANVLFPGVAPIEYEKNSEIWILADLVNSRKTQVPFDYYDVPLSCPLPNVVSDTVKKQADFKRNNIGSRLQGHDYKLAPFHLKVLQNLPCTVLCSLPMTLDAKRIKKLQMLIDRQYRVQLQLDSLPVLMRSQELNYAARGYPIGFKSPSSATDNKGGEEAAYYLYNHLRFSITYHEDAQVFDGVRITGFDVHPVSYTHSPQEVESCNANIQNIDNHPSKYLQIPTTSSTGAGAAKITMSYEIQWNHNDLTWADRWDVYLIGSPDDDIHYLSIVNSLMIVIFLTGAISTIMVRTLRKDIAGYNEMAGGAMDDEAAAEETGWKLIHGDVFRPPSTSPLVLAIFVGTGAQIGAAFFFTLLCAILGMLNPLKKGQTLTAILILYVLCGSIAGYSSAKICKFCSSNATTASSKTTSGSSSSSTNNNNNAALANWKTNTILTATALPGLLVGMFCILNIFLSFAGAATAVSFFTILKLFLLWICISTPLVFVGSILGYRQPPQEVPTKIKQIPRILPDPIPIHVQPTVSILIGGILPFGSVCIELAFIMSALWLHQYYYVMGFLLAVCIILALTCAQVSAVLCYLRLCTEDYRWWWMSFWNCASAGLYLFAYSLWFLSSRMNLVGVLPVIVYLTYMFMISICFGLVCGCIGFLSSFYFCRTIYGAVKVD